MSIRDDDNLDNYLGAEGNATASGIGLHWLKADRLVLLHERLWEMGTKSTQTWLDVLDHLSEFLTQNTLRWRFSSAAILSSCGRATER